MSEISEHGKRCGCGDDVHVLMWTNWKLVQAEDELARVRFENGRLVVALMKIRDAVDHLGRDHAFTYCNEIAAETLREHTP